MSLRCVLLACPWLKVRANGDLQWTGNIKYKTLHNSKHSCPAGGSWFQPSIQLLKVPVTQWQLIDTFNNILQTLRPDLFSRHPNCRRFWTIFFLPRCRFQPLCLSTSTFDLILVPKHRACEVSRKAGRLPS